jgi:hypothetical protein
MIRDGHKHKTSNGKNIEAKRIESFGNGVFFDIEAKLTRSIVKKLFSKRKPNNKRV